MVTNVVFRTENVGYVSAPLIHSIVHEVSVANSYFAFDYEKHLLNFVAFLKYRAASCIFGVTART